ncbi:MAG: four helix bundle protein [Burkholderiales bacterium]|nr:four helix bundle protein [Burkholderiales bacterium]
MSIPANIAEGCSGGSDRNFARHLHIAIGSACELEYHLLLAADLGFIPTSERDSLFRQLIDVRRMLIRLVQKLDSTRRS